MVSKAKRFLQVTTDDLTATIEVGETVSEAIDLHGTFLCGLEIPANFDGSEITFQTSRDGSTYRRARNTSNDIITVTVTPGENTSIAPTDFSMWRYIKLVTTTPQATTDTVIGLVTRPLS